MHPEKINWLWVYLGSKSRIR